MTDSKPDYLILSEIQSKLGESDVYMAARLGVRPKLYKQLQSGEKPLLGHYRETAETIWQQLHLNETQPSIRELMETLEIARYELAALLGLSPSRMRNAVELNNDPLLRKILTSELEKPGLIKSLSKK